MSEEILRVLMQLFALASSTNDVSSEGRNIIRHSLSTELTKARVEKFLLIYDQYLKDFHSLKTTNQGSLLREQIFDACKNSNTNLTPFQKHIVLLRVLEYIFVDGEISPHEKEFILILNETFLIPSQTLADCFEYIRSKEGNFYDNERMMIVSNAPNLEFSKTKLVTEANFDGYLIILYIKELHLFVFKYIGNSALFISSRPVVSNRTYILNSGAALRGQKMTPVYYSDILAEFMDNDSEQKLVFEAKGVSYQFPSGDSGLQNFSIRERNGRMISLMGGSGAGKSTMLNVLNGSQKPTTGDITINGINIYTQKKKLQGLIGFISQDDLLIEELTVFQNLYYSAKLSFANLSEEEISSKVNTLLQSLGLFEAKDLKVGNPIEKVISGGQRKRLNIALELIREPSVLFVDEPTSGLSSRDSENIMDLLKELALKGKLVFVVIHQPSSYIFKLFDRLILLDSGGYLIYYGEPVDSVSYFKSAAKHIDADESECLKCGNVNSELIFNIIEQKVVDEYGAKINRRKTAPNEWSRKFNDFQESNPTKHNSYPTTPIQNKLSPPSAFKQFIIYLTRDVRAKITNKQYLIINILEAPVLALFMAYFVRYAAWSRDGQMEYKYFFNENIPAYIFMAIVVALFIGMTVSAEEIFKDRMLRKRERFLNLSYGSYLFSKFTLLFVISAVQTWLFIIIGNTILGIEDMTLRYWLVMFSVSFFANMVGLNISSSFKSAVAIYIIIPFLIIPQLIFSGVIVSFDRLNPTVSSRRVVPLIGEVMASRWGYEALIVTQFKDNPIERILYDADKSISEVNYLKSYWIVELNAQLQFIRFNRNDSTKFSKIDKFCHTIQHEISSIHEGSNYPFYEFKHEFNSHSVTTEQLEEIANYLTLYKKYLNKTFVDNSKKRDQAIYSIEKNNPWNLSFNDLKERYVNESVTNAVKLHHKRNKVILVDEKLVPISDPIFRDSKGIRSHYYAPNKRIFGYKISTFWFNIGVLWFFSLSFMIALYFNLFKKLFAFFQSSKPR